MTLYFIGLGLNNEKDITVNGLDAVKKCDVIYLESYTSILNCKKEDLEEFYGKKVITARRDMVEADDNEIIKNAKEKNVAFLVIGDPFGATTHVDLYLRAKKEKIKCEIIHNASILSALGVTGLQLYKFGKTTSIPMENENIEAPYDVLKQNLKNGLHTLFLLDLDIIENKFMKVNDAIRYLLKVELKRNEKVISEKNLVVGCARIGSKDQIVKCGSANLLMNYDFGKPVHCLVIPGKLHFMEEEALNLN